MAPVRITDVDDERITDYIGMRDPAHRRRVEGDELFLAEGLNVIRRLLASAYDVRSVLVTPSRLDRLEEDLVGATFPIYVAERELLAQVAGFDLHRGAVAAANRSALHTLSDVIASSRTIAVLEALNDAENLGAIARSARALGVDALVLDPTCTDPFYRRTVRVSMGEILLLPVVRSADWAGDLTLLAEAGFRMIALTPSAHAASIHDVVRAPGDRVAILLGTEGGGLTAATLARSEAVRIPIRADVDSLNVGHAAAIAFACLGRDVTRR